MRLNFEEDPFNFRVMYTKEEEVYYIKIESREAGYPKWKTYNDGYVKDIDKLRDELLSTVGDEMNDI